MVERILKSGWTRVKFGEVVHLNTDRIADPQTEDIERYVGIEHIEPEDLRIRAWGLVEEGTTFTNYFKPGQVLFVKRRAYQRKVALAEFEGVCSGDIYVLEPKDDRLLPDLLPFICQTDAFFAHAVNTSAGSLSPRTNWRQLSEYEFALPPLVEQQRMATVLWLSERLRREYHDGVGKAGTLLHSAIREVASTSARVLPLSELCSHITSGSRAWARYYSDAGSVFFRITNMQRGCIRAGWDDTRFVTAPDTEEASRTRVRPGDVLVSITAELGLVTLVEQGFPEAYVNQHIGLLRPYSSRVNPRFLAYFLASPSGMQQFQRFNDYGAKAGMNLRNLGRVEVPVMSMEDQLSISERLTELDRSWVGMRIRFAEACEIQRRLNTQLLGGPAA